MIRLQVGYGQHGSIAAQGDLTPSAAMHLFDQLAAQASHVPFQVIEVCEDPGLLVVVCGTHPEVPELTPRRPPADWTGLVYRFTGPPGHFGQLYTHVLILVSRQPSLFAPHVREAMSLSLSPPPSLWSHRS